MALRRGFKKEANDYAREFREELLLSAHEPLCPWLLAKHLEIPVLELTFFESFNPEATQTLTGEAQNQFSAVSIFSGRRRVVIHNDAHHPHRQAANLAHELGHAILLHPPTPPFTDDGERNYSSEIKKLEEEANWLGPALLISEEAALHIYRSQMPIDEASQTYGVSEQLINMRINVTGAKKRSAYPRSRR